MQQATTTNDIVAKLKESGEYQRYVQLFVWMLMMINDSCISHTTHNTNHHTHTQTPRCLSFETIAKSRLESSFRNLGQTRNRTLQKSNILGGSHDQACSSWKIIDTAASRGQTRITTIGARIDDSMLLLLYIRWWWWWWWCEQKIIIILRLSRSRQQSS